MEYFVEVVTNSKGQKFVMLVDEDFKIIEEVLYYLNHLNQQHKSINTIETYCRSLKKYYEWLSFRNLSYSEVSHQNISDFIDFLESDNNKTKSLAANTMNKYIASLSSFYDYHSTIHNLSLNPFKTFGSDNSYRNHHKKSSSNFFKRKVPKNTVSKRLFPKQIVEFYESIKLSTKNKAVLTRNLLIFRLLYETGMRVSECINFRLNDYSIPDPIDEIGFIYIREHSILYHPDHSFKTLERKIPVSMNLIYEIEEYVSNVREQKGDISTVFVNHSGANKGSYLIRKTINKFFRRVSIMSDVYCTPHMLRHTHGTELIENGYEQEYVKHRLGHASIESTEKYVHLSLDAQIKAYEGFLISKGRM